MVCAPLGLVDEQRSPDVPLVKSTSTQVSRWLRDGCDDVAGNACSKDPLVVREQSFVEARVLDRGVLSGAGARIGPSAANCPRRVILLV